MESVVCKHCGAVDDYRTSEQSFNNATHIRADCNQCGKWIKWLPQQKPPVCYIGKYRGWLISDITDADWINWVLKNCALKNAVYNQLANRLTQLQTPA